MGRALRCELRAAGDRAEGAACAHPGRLHLHPGAIVGGLIIGIGEKLAEFYWGPLVGGGIENWVAYVIALVFLMVRPQGLFGDKIIERI